MRAKHAAGNRRRHRLPQKRSWPRRIGLPLLVLAGAVLPLLAAVLWTPFPVTAAQLRIEGNFRLLDPKQVRQILAPHLERSLFAVDLRGMQEDLEKMPWVARARVLRTWPPGLLVHIREHRPAARWAAGDYVDPGGRLFPALSDGAELPQLAGPPGTAAEVLARYRELAPLLGRAGLSLRGLQLDPACCWHLRLACGAELVAGRDDWHPALERFARVYPALAASHGAALARADLRYSNGLAVAWQQPGSSSCGAAAGSEEWQL